MFLHTKFTSKYLIRFRTYPSLSGSQKFSPDSHFGTVSTKISPQKYFFLASTKSAHSVKVCLTVIAAFHAPQTGGSSFFKRKEGMKKCTTNAWLNQANRGKT